MNWQKFQSEVSFLWADETGANYGHSHAEEVKSLLQRRGWELGAMELKGASKQQQMAQAWEWYKEEYPHLVQ